MLQFLFDTDHVTLFSYCHPPLMQRFLAHPLGVGVSAVTVEEVFRGRLAKFSQRLAGAVQIQAYANLVASVHLFQQFSIVPFDQASEKQFQQLRTLRLKVGTRDLKIAAVAMVNGLTVLTSNLKHFGLIPGVILDDWSK